MRVQLTVRVLPDVADYIADQAHQATRTSGIRVSVNEAAAAFLERAVAEGWRITPAQLQTSRPGHAQPPPAGPGPTTQPPGE